MGWCFWILPGGPHLPSTWDSDCELASGDLGDRHDSRSDSSNQGGVLLCGLITFPWTLHLLCPERCQDQVAMTMGTKPSNGHSIHGPARFLSSAGRWPDCGYFRTLSFPLESGSRPNAYGRLEYGQNMQGPPPGTWEQSLCRWIEARMLRWEPILNHPGRP